MSATPYNKSNPAHVCKFNVHYLGNCEDMNQDVAYDNNETKGVSIFREYYLFIIPWTFTSNWGGGVVAWENARNF